MHFYGVAPGFPRSEITIVQSVSLRRVFFIFDQNWESLGIRDIGEKEAIFAKMSVTKVRFFNLRCELLELVLKLYHFSQILPTFLRNEKNKVTSESVEKNRKIYLTPTLSQNPLIHRLSES